MNKSMSLPKISLHQILPQLGELHNLVVIKLGDDSEDWDYVAQKCEDCNIAKFRETQDKEGHREVMLQTSPNLGKDYESL